MMRNTAKIMTIKTVDVDSATTRDDPRPTDHDEILDDEAILKTWISQGLAGLGSVYVRSHAWLDSQD